MSDKKDLERTIEKLMRSSIVVTPLAIANYLWDAGWRPPPEPQLQRRPTVTELEAILQRTDVHVEVQPSGEIRAAPPEPQAERQPNEAADEAFWADMSSTRPTTWRPREKSPEPQAAAPEVDPELLEYAQYVLDTYHGALAARADSLSSQIQTVLASRQETLDMAGAEIRKHSERAHDAEAAVKRLMEAGTKARDLLREIEAFYLPQGEIFKAARASGAAKELDAALTQAGGDDGC